MNARALILDGLALLGALVLALVPPSPAWVEHDYANGIYPVVQSAASSFTNLFPIALTDVLAIVIVGGLITWWVLRLRQSRGRLKTIAFMSAHTVGIASLLAIVFLCAWGFNYRRPPMTSRIAFDATRVTTASVGAYVKSIVDELNATAPAAHAYALDEQTLETDLRADYEPVVRALGDAHDVTVTRPKSTIVNRYLSFAGIGGLFDPFAYETIVNADFLPFERPFAIAHEWGHVAAFADETDANYIAALTTLRSPHPFIRYSGLFWIYGYLPRELTAKYPVSPRVAADLNDAYARYNRYLNHIAFTLQWSAYDRYLKVNRVPSGVVSYSLFVTLLVGTPRDALGLPVERGGRSSP